MDKDGWTTPNAKRQKLTLIDLTCENETTTESNNISSTPSTSFSTPTSTTSTSERPPCQYGVKCYRKNEMHLLEFSHPLCMQL